MSLCNCLYGFMQFIVWIYVITCMALILWIYIIEPLILWIYVNDFMDLCHYFSGFMIMIQLIDALDFTDFSSDMDRNLDKFKV